MSAPISKKDLLFLRNYSYVKGGLIPLDNLLESHAALLSQVARLREGLKNLLKADLYADAEGVWYVADSDTKDGESAVKAARALLAETGQP